MEFLEDKWSVRHSRENMVMLKQHPLYLAVQLQNNQLFPI